MPLTIQLKDLPTAFNTIKFGNKLLQPLGTVISTKLYSSWPGGQGSRFLKSVVKINLRQSLQGRIQAVVQGRQPFWVLLRYEDLPTVCYICGQLGHGQSYCPFAAIAKVTGDRGAWMQARPAGHLIETPDMSDASTSKQKPKHHKPIPYVFHTYVKAESANQSCPSVDASGSSSTVTIPPAPAAPLISGIFSLFHCYVPPYSNSPRISVVNNIPCHRRHHQPFKLIESYLHNHISFSYADPLLGNYFVVSVPLALADVEMSCIHALSDLQGMQLCDKKRPRDDDDAGTSTITLKKIKLPPLQVTDFPDIGMDLELLPDDLLDSDPDMIAVSAALTDSMGEEATPLRPPGPG
ncbi:hypothetical protein LINGRAHAP2_LOCUS4178 [Linum grandiflorum]